MKFLEKEILIMKHISLIHYIVSILLIITSCNSKESVKQPINKNNIQIEHNTSPEILREQLIGRAKKILNNTERTPLPFQTEFKEYKNKEIADLLEKKGEPNALDSIFKSSDLENSWFKGEISFEIPNSKCNFVTRLESPLENYETLIYILDGRYGHRYIYHPIYAIVINKNSLQLKSSSFIGVAFLSNFANDTGKNKYSYTKFSIDSTLEISTEIREDFNYNFYSKYFKKQNILSDGQISQKPTKTYSYESSFDLMYYYQIEDSITVLLNDETNEDKDYFCSHLELEGFGFNNPPFSNQFKDKLVVRDELGRIRFEVINYNKALNFSSCENKKDICFDAHFIHYSYELSPISTTEPQILEVKYKHLPNGKLQLKTRLSRTSNTLKNTSWYVYDLIHTTDYDSSGTSNHSYHNTSNWLRSYYYHSVPDELPFDSVYIEEPELTTLEKK